MGDRTTDAGRDRSVTIRARVVIAYAPDPKAEGRWQFLGRVPLSIGRAPSGDDRLIVDDIEMSRTHAIVGKGEDGRWRVVDDDSRNGTLVDGVRVSQAELSDGAVLRVGSTLVVFQLAELCTLELHAPEGVPLLGPSIEMQRVRGEVIGAGCKSGPVVLLGDSGVGKDATARAIHAASGREGRYVSVRCGSVPRDRLEAELFGCAASTAPAGLVAAAAGGTLFLDEIDELPMQVQGRLQQAVDGELSEAGGTSAVAIDVRLIAATSGDLELAVEAGHFRDDLHRRFAGSVIEIPPLRDRRDDILPIARHILAREAPDKEISVDAAEALLLHDWPDNVREMEGVLATAITRAGAVPALQLEHLPRPIAAPLDDRVPLAPGPPTGELPALPAAGVAPRSAAELQRVLITFHGSARRAAEFFGTDTDQVLRWAKHLGVRVDPDPK